MVQHSKWSGRFRRLFSYELSYLNSVVKLWYKLTLEVVFLQ